MAIPPFVLRIYADSSRVKAGVAQAQGQAERFPVGLIFAPLQPPWWSRSAGGTPERTSGSRPHIPELLTPTIS